MLRGGLEERLLAGAQVARPKSLDQLAVQGRRLGARERRYVEPAQPERERRQKS